MKSAETRITADVAAQFGLVTESFWQNNFQDVVIQRTTALARDAQVCGLIFLLRKCRGREIVQLSRLAHTVVSRP